ncbi:MAG: DUF1272 domain-containing protein [Acidimicrobiales bacterium]|nr:DUF1272 domain-containing protein [Hyphomonadaceae bacterium]RZV42414.1 MAG: DUF1272 domain-containing protein [Acidimicrobiales bacterium]
MVLELRPNCEYCDKDLPNDAEDARICTYECTFCANCVETILENVCPNCGGGFTPRPKRPAKSWRKGLSIVHQPMSTKQRSLNYSKDNIAGLTAKLKNIPPLQR